MIANSGQKQKQMDKATTKEYCIKYQLFRIIVQEHHCFAEGFLKK